MPGHLTRRDLIKISGFGAVAVGALGGGPIRSSARKPRVVVVGAGAFGSWTALHLRRRGAEVTLLDAWGPGNSRASSGGESRMIRAIYGADRIYSEMVLRGFEQFAELEQVTSSRLYYETGAIWMMHGDNEYVTAALPILEDLSLPVESLTSDAAAQRWPQIDFADIDSVVFEPRAGVLAARMICRLVTERFIREGGEYRIAQVEPEPSQNGVMQAVIGSDGQRLEADRFVFCCGPWLGRVFPEVIGEAVAPSRQEVFFFGPPAGSTQFDFGQLPGWVDFDERLVYGFPRLFGRGLKLADDTRGEPFDPTAGDRAPSAAGIERARQFLARRFPAMAGAPLVETRVCQYENSPDGDLIVDRHPQAENCWLAGGGSGHGFKLGPAVGEKIAASVLDGTALDAKLSLARLAEGGDRSTQFD